jgi:hypothetical protein
LLHDGRADIFSCRRDTFHGSCRFTVPWIRNDDLDNYKLS